MVPVPVLVVIDEVVALALPALLVVLLLVSSQVRSVKLFVSPLAVVVPLLPAVATLDDVELAEKFPVSVTRLLLFLEVAPMAAPTVTSRLLALVDCVTREKLSQYVGALCQAVVCW